MWPKVRFFIGFETFLYKSNIQLYLLLYMLLILMTCAVKLIDGINMQ